MFCLILRASVIYLKGLGALVEATKHLGVFIRVWQERQAGEVTVQTVLVAVFATCR